MLSVFTLASSHDCACTDTPESLAVCMKATITPGTICKALVKCQLDTVTHMRNPNTSEAEARGQPGLEFHPE